MSEQPKSFTQLSIIKQTFPSESSLRALTQFAMDRDGIPHEQIEDSLRVISRRFDRFPLKMRALGLYTNRRIELLGNKETVKVPVFLPGWRVSSVRGPTAWVNATPYVPPAGPSAMDVRKLFGLLLLGQILVDTMENWGRISGNVSLARVGALVYSRMMFKVVDRIAGTGGDHMRSDQLKYVFAKYFILNMMGSPHPDTADALAASLTPQTGPAALAAFEAACLTGQRQPMTEAAEEEALRSYLKGLAEDAPEPQGGRTELDPGQFYGMGILDFIRTLSSSDPWLSRLTARGFLQTFASLYNPQALLATEDPAYFFAALANHQAGSEMVNSFSFDPVYGDEGPVALLELARLVG